MPYSLHAQRIGRPALFPRELSASRRFSLEADADPRERVIVLSGGSEHCLQDQSDRSPATGWSIEFIARGTGRMTVNGDSYALLPGTACTFAPGCSRSVVADGAEGLVRYYVEFGGRDAGTLLRRAAPPLGWPVQTSVPAEVAALFEELLRSGLRKTPFSGRITALLVEHLVLKLAESMVPLPVADSPAFATYCRCRQHLERRWRDITTLEQAARECQVDAAYLCRLFRRFDRQSPYQYLLELKMTYAAERLRTSDGRVKKVADELGFQDTFHFSRVFKRLVGISPGRFARTQVPLAPDHRGESGFIVTGPINPDSSGSHLIAVNRPSGPRFSASRAGKLTL